LGKFVKKNYKRFLIMTEKGESRLGQGEAHPRRDKGFRRYEESRRLTGAPKARAAVAPRRVRGSGTATG